MDRRTDGQTEAFAIFQTLLIKSMGIIITTNNTNVMKNLTGVKSISLFLTKQEWLSFVLTSHQLRDWATG